MSVYLQKKARKEYYSGTDRCDPSNEKKKKVPREGDKKRPCSWNGERQITFGWSIVEAAEPVYSGRSASSILREEHARLLKILTL